MVQLKVASLGKGVAVSGRHSVYAVSHTTDDAAIEAYVQFGRALVARIRELNVPWTTVSGDWTETWPPWRVREVVGSAIENVLVFATEEFTAPLLPLTLELLERARLVPFGQTMSSSDTLDGLRDQPILFFRDYALRSVVRTLMEESTLEPTEGQLRAGARRALEAWRSPHVDWHVIAYVKGAGPDGRNDVTLCPEFRLTHGQMRDNRYVPDPDLPWAGSRAFTMGLLVGPARVMKGTPDRKPFRIAIQTANRCLMSLRMIRPGHYGVQELWIVPTDAFYASAPLQQIQATDLEVNIGPNLLVDPVWINQEDGRQCDELVRAWDAGTFAPIAVALDRFHFASGRMLPEDRLIDLVIALEGSLLAGNVRDQLKYRCALRGAYLLGDTRNPAHTYEIFQAAYDARSRMVHGAKRLGHIDPKHLAGMTQADFVEEVHRLVRETLVRFMHAAISGTPAGKLVESLDREIVQRLDRREGGCMATE